MAQNNNSENSNIAEILRAIINGSTDYPEFKDNPPSKIALLLMLLGNDIFAIKEIVENLPNPMVFKGTLGTGGTISTLPTASSENEGFVYIVITDGTYAGQSASAGDMFISNGSAWVIVPSGDEQGAIVISQTLTAGQTSITFNNSAITATSFISVASEAWYTASTQTTGSVTITFPAQASDMLVQIMVAN